MPKNAVKKVKAIRAKAPKTRKAPKTKAPRASVKASVKSRAKRGKHGTMNLSGKLSVKNATKASRLLASFKKAGGDLDKLAKSIHVNPWTIYRWARGLNEPRDLALSALKLAIEGVANGVMNGTVPNGNGGSKVTAAQILDYIVSKGAEGATDDEIEAALNASHQTASARRRGLVVKGAIIDSGQTRPTRSGRSASVWQAALAPWQATPAPQ